SPRELRQSHQRTFANKAVGLSGALREHRYARKRVRAQIGHIPKHPYCRRSSRAVHIRIQSNLPKRLNCIRAQIRQSFDSVHLSCHVTSFPSDPREVASRGFRFWPENHKTRSEEHTSEL